MSGKYTGVSSFEGTQVQVVAVFKQTKRNPLFGAPGLRHTHNMEELKIPTPGLLTNVQMLWNVIF